MEKENFKIIFCGEDSFSNVVLNSLVEAGHEIVGVIIPEYANNAYLKLVKTCEENGLPWIRHKNINSEDVINWIIPRKPDIGVSAHFSKIIKPKLLSIPRLGFINLHPSPLPYYRGATPQHWQIVNGETDTAVTVHYINEGIDTGDIIIQEFFKIDPNDYVSDLQNKWLKRYPHIVVNALENIKKGEKAIPQPDIETKYYGFLKPEDLILTDEMSTSEIFGRIKGFSLPYEGARYNDMIIYKAEVIDKIEEAIYSLPIGIHESQEGKPIFRTKDGALKIVKSRKIKS